MKIPSLIEAEDIFNKVCGENNDFWCQHSKVTAFAAETIARNLGLDTEKAYILGMLHDIGRQEKTLLSKHILLGYRLLSDMGYGGVARVCLTHSFPVKDDFSVYGDDNDCTQEEVDFIMNYINSCDYDIYDELIQLCDAISMAEGVCLLQVRLVDIAIRHGINVYTIKKWEKLFYIKNVFETSLGKSIYSLFDNVILSSWNETPWK